MDKKINAACLTVYIITIYAAPVNAGPAERTTSAASQCFGPMHLTIITIDLLRQHIVATISHASRL